MLVYFSEKDIELLEKFSDIVDLSDLREHCGRLVDMEENYIYTLLFMLELCLAKVVDYPVEVAMLRDKITQWFRIYNIYRGCD